MIIDLFAVGGLGLNLTSADTLVFMEHDWNPMKDLQVFVLAYAHYGRISVASLYAFAYGYI